jgi:hypothetical protein
MTTVATTEAIAKAAYTIYHNGTIFSKQLALMLVVLVLVLVLVAVLVAVMVVNFLFRK